MGVYIDMEMPQKTYAHCMLIKSIDGSVQLLVCTKNSGEISEWESYDLVPVPPHGDLIDRDKLREKEFIHGGDAYAVVMSRDIRNAPTIIPAEEGE